MSTQLAAPPLQTDLIESSKNPIITKPWATWLRSLVDRAQVAAFQILTQSYTAQTDAIALTSLLPLAGGRYRVSSHLRITTAASVSSTIAVSVTTTEGGVTCLYNGAVYAGNLVSEPQTGSFLVRCDPATPLQFETIYTSVNANEMAYDLDIAVEAL